MTQLAEGLTYRHFEFHESQCHLLEVDLRKRSLRPVLAGDAFPFLRIYPVIEAVEQGALASVGGGYNVVWLMNLGYADQPLHPLVVDREIWTTGRPGYGVLIGEHHVEMRRNRIQIIVWRPDNTAFEVEAVNRGHDDRIVAFTARGGTNQRPIAGRHYVQLGQPGWWTPGNHGESQHRLMTVLQVGTDPIAPEADTVVLEAPWGLKLHVDDEVAWVQRLGGKHVRYLVSGWPQIVRDGVNVVPELDLQGVDSPGPDAWFVKPNPRMCIGASKNGRTAYICTVQGRIPGSEGLRLMELATLMLRHGAYSAINFDGGGSAFMHTQRDGLVADSSYGDGTLQGLRPDHYSVSVF